jgi:hypothetical protein
VPRRQVLQRRVLRRRALAEVVGADGVARLRQPDVERALLAPQRLAAAAVAAD